MKTYHKILLGVLAVVLIGVCNKAVNESGWIEKDRARLDSISKIEAERTAQRVARNKIPQNIGEDGIVIQAEYHLKANLLHDPDSYESIKWYKVETKDSSIFVVRHDYRAKNKFGGLVRESKVFTMDKMGNVLGVK